MEEMHVYKAIAEIQGLVTAQERSHAKVTMRAGGSYSYDYIGEGTLMNLVRPALAERGVAVFANGEVVTLSADGKLAHVRVVLTFVSSEDGSRHAAAMPGVAADMGDKAVAKALTSATRYCLWKTFLVPSEDPAADEAGTNTSYEPAPPPTADGEERLVALSRELTETVRHIAVRKGKTSDVAKLLAEQAGPSGVHPDYLQKLIARLDALPDVPLEGSGTPPDAPAPSLLGEPSNQDGEGATEAQRDELAKLLVSLSTLDQSGRDWPGLIQTKVGELFGKQSTKDLSESEMRQLIEMATATQLQLQETT